VKAPTFACICAGLLASVAPAALGGVNPRSRSTSATRQFTVYCEDTLLRSRVTSFADEVKHDVLELIGARDQWKVPIVITLEMAARPNEVTNPVGMVFAETPDGPTIQLGVTIGADPAAVHLQKHIMRAVLLDYMHREHPPRKGEPYAEPPWWFISGAIEKIRQRDQGIEAGLFRQLIETNKLPAVTDFLPGRGMELGPTATAFDNACAFALLQMLLDQPEGKARLGQLLRDWPTARGDAAAALIKAFPAIGPDANGLQKWWTLNLARFAASDRYRGLSAEDTDKELQVLLEFDVVKDKAGKTEHFAIGQFKDFSKLRGAKLAAKKQQAAVIALSTKANALLRPVLADYEQVFALLASGRTRGIAERIHAAEAYRTAVLQRKSDIVDYLNWFEATQLESWSGAFDGYLRAAQAAEQEPTHTALGAAISAYLDILEDELKPVAPAKGR